MTRILAARLSLGRLVRKVTADVARGADTPVTITTDELSEWLGRPRVVDDIPDRTSAPGVATGLAVTGVGGDVLFIETTAFPTGPDSEPGLTLTGQLGDVMKESAQAALTYCRSRSKDLNVQNDFFDQTDIHIHVPAGAIPKDGPSAGISMCTSLVSAITKRAVYRDIAMTGEITLRGRVLKIGGLKEKLLAANRGGVTEVIIPKQNRIDMKEVPKEILKGLTVHDVESVDEVLKLALREAAIEELIPRLKGQKPEGINSDGDSVHAH